MKQYSFARAFLLMLCFFAPSAYLKAEAYTRDGFMLGMLLGTGNAHLEYLVPQDPHANKFMASSSALYVSLQIGRMATPDFVVHLNGFYIYTPGEREEERVDKNKSLHSGNTAGVSNLPSETLELKHRYQSYGFGIGFTYHFPWDMYISPEFRSAVFASLERIENHENVTGPYTRETALLQGTGMGVTIGKAFWIAAEWSIALSFFYHVDWLQFRNYEIRDACKKDDFFNRDEYLPCIGEGSSFQAGHEAQNFTGSARQYMLGGALSIIYN